MAETIAIPKRDISKLVQLLEQFSEVQDNLEDHLLSRNTVLLRQLRRARGEHRRGQLKTWAQLRSRYA